MSLIAARINGESATTIDVVDRGMSYGDGVFRTVCIVSGKPRCWAYHEWQLSEDCRRLSLPVPDSARLMADLNALFTDDADGIAKIIVTRGVGGRGYTPPVECQPTHVVLRYPPPSYPNEYVDQGVAVGIAETRLARQPALAGIKHLNRLEQVLARRECREKGWPEAVMCTDDGRVVSGSMSNLFIYRSNRLETPALDEAGVSGATRACLIERFSDQGHAVAVNDLHLSDLLAADEVFLCNSAMPVWPIRAIDRQTISKGPMAALAKTLIVNEVH